MNTTTATSSKVADTIQKQIGFFPLAEIGARNFFITSDSLIFTAKPTTRLVQVTVRLDRTDTYTVTVMRRTDCATLFEAENIYADQVGEIIRYLPRALGGE